MRRTWLLALPGALLVLSGCASSPQAEVRDDVNAVLAAANDESPEAVRAAVDDLLATLREQVGSNDLTAAQAEPVRAAALAVRDSVAALEVEQSPSPEPSPTPEPTPEPSPTPTPSPTPSPTPEPTEEPEPTQPPEPTEEPEQTGEPTEEEPEQTEEPAEELVPTPETDEQAADAQPAAEGTGSPAP